MIEISDEVLEFAKRELSQIKSIVKIIYFKSERNKLDKIAKEILSLISRLCNKVVVEYYDRNSEIAKKFKVDLFPAFIIHGVRPYNIRFFGLPIGYEFGTFIRDLVDASTGKVKLLPKTIDLLKSINKEVRISVFVTPTCPYCPLMVRLAHKFAIVNDKIYADMIDAVEFPEIARKWNVVNVPKTIINGKFEIEGLVNELVLAKKIIDILNPA